MPQPLPTNPKASQHKLPPPMSMLLPKSTPKASNVDLNFDLEGALEKMHVTVPLKEIIKVPSMKNRFERFFKVLDEPSRSPYYVTSRSFQGTI
jgi:hypothetical protein